MMSNDVPATPRPRPPGNVRRSMSLKLQTPPPPYASSFLFPSKQPKEDLNDDLGSLSTSAPEDVSNVLRSGIGSVLSPIRHDEGEEQDWFNESSREELTELLLKADGLIKERENELNVTSAVCKTLYENNVSLKSKHQALLARIPSSPTISSSVLPSPVSSPPQLPYESSSHSPSPPTKLRLRHTRRISMSHNDITRLADQNAELLLKLEKLEQESAQTDLSGRRALKRLEREIQLLREELEETQARGEALEEKARLGCNVEAIWRRKEREKEREVKERKRRSGRSEDEAEERKDFAPPNELSVLSRSTFRFPKSRKSEPALEQLVPSRSEYLHEEQRDSDEGECDSSPPPFTEVDSTLTSSSNTSPSRPQPTLIAQLLAKISELEETNARIMQQQAETTEKLQAVQQETENMSRVYESLGGEGGLIWAGDEEALYFDDEDVVGQDEGEGEFGEQGRGGMMRFSSWRKVIEDDQSTIRTSSQKSTAGSMSERGTSSRRGSVRHQRSRGSLSRGSHGRVSVSMSILPASRKNRKSVVGLFDPPSSSHHHNERGVEIDRTSPALSTLSLDSKSGTPFSTNHYQSDRQASASPNHATLDAELGGLGISLDATGPGPGSVSSSSGRNVSNHHLRTTSLYDLSCLGSPSHTPSHTPTPSLSHIGGTRSSGNAYISHSSSPISSSLPSRMFTSPTQDQPVDEPATPILPGGVQFTLEQPTPFIPQGQTKTPWEQSADGLLPSKESKHSLRYRRMTQTVRSRAERWEDGRFKETLKGLGPPPGKNVVVRSVRRKKSTLESAFDVFMDAFASSRMEQQDEECVECQEVPLVVGMNADGLSSPDDSASRSPFPDLPLPESETSILPSSPSSHEPTPDHGANAVETAEVSPPQERRGLTRVILEIWLWLQFAVIVLVFLWAMARRGPKAVLYEAEKRKSTHY